MKAVCLELSLAETMDYSMVVRSAGMMDLKKAGQLDKMMDLLKVALKAGQ
jgi:hypothetical protein